MRVLKALVFLTAAVFLSCGGNKTATIWTDRPEFAIYGEFFNTVQNQYKVSIRYVEFPGAKLNFRRGDTNIPDIVAASYLANSSMSAKFQSLNSLLGGQNLSRNIFYPRLLAMGRKDRTQYLLPVSFNIPALVFSRDNEPELSNQFTIGFDEIKSVSRPFNTMTRGAYTRMGFSPLWNDSFLLTAASLYGASFRENSPLAWDSAALERSMIFINNWTSEINTSIQANDDFTFKYFIQPPERLIQSGRILFYYMESDELFTLNEDIKSHLDFRWIMEDDRIPITEDSVFLGIPRRARSQRAAKAFIQWFFNVESQRRLLEFSSMYRLNESIFGISGGFSALRQVTEQIYPVFYPGLLGRMPPSENFSMPNALPGNWVVLRERVILPYLHDRARAESADDIQPLQRRLSDWLRLNR